MGEERGKDDEGGSSYIGMGRLSIVRTNMNIDARCADEKIPGLCKEGPQRHANSPKKMEKVLIKHAREPFIGTVPTKRK